LRESPAQLTGARTSTNRDAARVGWSKVKDRGWYERDAWRFDPTLTD
jgi:hypothetical protein